MDKQSLAVINSLHPDIRLAASKAYVAANAVLTGRAKVIFLEGFRSLKRSAELYALGRTKINPDGKSAKKPKGNIVSNAMPGQSIHNYALAFDIVLELDGKNYSWDDLKDYDGDGVADWLEAAKAIKSCGFEWGGDWKNFKDLPHFQMDFGLSWQQCKVLVERGQFIPGTQYIDIHPQDLKPGLLRAITTLNLRSGQGTNFDVLDVIQKGQEVQILNDYGNWIEVQFGKRKGFAFAKYLSR